MMILLWGISLLVLNFRAFNVIKPVSALVLAVIVLILSIIWLFLYACIVRRSMGLSLISSFDFWYASEERDFFFFVEYFMVLCRVVYGSL